VLSSCSSSNQTGQSGSTAGIPSTLLNLTKEEQEARIKAEKIKIAIEKIKEASVKKLFIKVFTSDGSAKSLLVDEKMSVGQVTRILAEKNHVALDPKWALVELVPDLYMERVYEDHEQLVENCLLWKVDSKNTLWFIERPEKFDLFSRPEVYLLGSSSSQKDDQMEDHSRYRIALKLRQIIFQMSGDFLIYSYIKCVIYNVYSVKYSRRQVKKVLK
jgi:amyloid beta A4 precursor protein-binding family B protein 1-interacting protein